MTQNLRMRIPIKESKEMIRKSKNEFMRRYANPDKEILEAIKNRKQITPKKLLRAINEKRKQNASKGRSEYKLMSPITLYAHLLKLRKSNAIARQQVSHKKVYYLSGEKINTELRKIDIIEALGDMLHSLHRGVGLLEAMKLIDTIFDNPERMKEFKNSVEALNDILSGAHSYNNL
jgi:DNA-binding transcriptional ArsR family regulator